MTMEPFQTSIFPEKKLVVRGNAGMDLVTGVTDYGDAPLFSIDGIASIDFISRNKIRVSYFVAHRRPDGKFDRRVVVAMDWDVAVWAKTRPNVRALDRMLIESGFDTAELRSN